MRTQAKVDASGLRQWFSFWEQGSISNHMKLGTRHASQYTPENSDFTLTVKNNSFQYLISHLPATMELEESLGTANQWLALVSCLEAENNQLSTLISRMFNMVNLDPRQILNQWQHLSKEQQWSFYLFYKMNLFDKRDYLTYAIAQCNNFEDIPKFIDTAIFLDPMEERIGEIAKQREKILQLMGVTTASVDFWHGFQNETSSRKKFFLLTAQTLQERTELITVIANLWEENGNLQAYFPEIKEKYPALYTYLQESNHFDVELNEYFAHYKFCKFTDTLREEDSRRAGDFYTLRFESRGQILYKIQGQYDAHFLWVDGLGLEWLDLLLEKVESKNSELKNPVIEIGRALVPTTTSKNIENAMKDGLLHEKYDKLDTISHMKDKSESNYKQLIASQLDLIDTIADLVVSLGKNYPKKDLVITADHGLSRLVALGFHKNAGITPPEGAEVHNLGRYCVLPPEQSETISGTSQYHNILAFQNYDHFSSSGHAPGELHGGISPEEILVPVIHYKRGNRKQDLAKQLPVSYQIPDYELYLNPKLEAVLCIFTEGVVESVEVRLSGKEYEGKMLEEDKWQVTIPQLNVDKSYQITVHLNCVLSKTQETIYIKRRGIIIVDDF